MTMPNHSHEPCPIEVPVKGGGLYIFEREPHPNGVRRFYSPATRDFSVWLTPEALRHTGEHEYLFSKIGDDVKVALAFLQSTPP